MFSNRQFLVCISFLWVYTLSSFRASPKSSLNRRGVDDLDPLKHRSVALRAKKESFTLIYLTTSSYRSPRFRLIFSASDLWKTEHSWLITPDVVNTNGVNEPCSTSIILRLYRRFFSSSSVCTTYLKGTYFRGN